MVTDPPGLTAACLAGNHAATESRFSEETYSSLCWILASHWRSAAGIFSTARMADSAPSIAGETDSAQLRESRAACATLVACETLPILPGGRSFAAAGSGAAACLPGSIAGGWIRRELRRPAQCKRPPGSLEVAVRASQLVHAAQFLVHPLQCRREHLLAVSGCSAVPGKLRRAARPCPDLALLLPRQRALLVAHLAQANAQGLQPSASCS